MKRWFPVPVLMLVLMLPKAAAGQSTAHAIQFDLEKLENGSAIPQGFGSVPDKLDVTYRVVDREGRPLESDVKFVERPYRYSIFDLTHRWVTASGQDAVAEISLLPQKGFQVTLRGVRIATHAGRHEPKLRLLKKDGTVLNERSVTVSDRSPATLVSRPGVTSPAGLRLQWETRNGEVGVAVVSLLLTPRGQKPFKPVVNSLGMTFEMVPGTQALVSETEVRAKDYAAFADENPKISNAWKDFSWPAWRTDLLVWMPPPDAKRAQQDPDEPVVNVSWEDARAFCRWLSEKEGRKYRLPTDREWSCAAGIAAAEDAEVFPGRLSGKVSNMVWGTHFPPEDRSESLKSFHAFEDGFSYTAPVTATSPDVFGLRGLGSNVKELCDDPLAEDSFFRVVRGGCWRTGGSPGSVSSSNRYGLPPFERSVSTGFRVVLEADTGRTE